MNLKKNIWIKVAAVVLAVALWVFVISKGYTDVSVNAPIEYENVPQGLRVVSSETVSSVSVDLRGHERIIKNLAADGVRVTLDLSELSDEGTYELAVRKESVKLPAFVRVVGIRPPTVTVTLGKAVKKSVPVKPKVMGAPEKGYKVVRMKVTPGNVNVRGAETDLEKLNWIETEPLDISDAKGNVKREVSVVGSDGMSSDRATVTVEIAIGKVRL